MSETIDKVLSSSGNNEIVHARYGESERVEVVTFLLQERLEQRVWEIKEIIELLDDGMKYRLLQEAKKIQ